MEESEKYITALIKLHRGLERKGPGDTSLTSRILSEFITLPTNPRIVDLGCGAGVAALFLAERFHGKVRAVDFSREFLDELTSRAVNRGLDHLIEAIEGDMGSLDWEPGTVDLLWSEGAAYNLTFEGALKAWRPLMASNGIAVISELSYFNREVPENLEAYWRRVYPNIGTESENADHAISLGFEVLGIERLPSESWWKTYLDPLSENMVRYRHDKDEMMRSVIDETEEEMRLFREYSEHYGYSFYIMKTAP